MVLLLVVDDASTGAADTLRASLVTGLGVSMRRAREGRCPLDPAMWRATDWMAVVASPSATGSARWAQPQFLASHDAREEDVGAFVNAIGMMLATVPPHGGSGYRPLEAVHDAVTLVTGDRPPQDEIEETLVASLPESSAHQPVGLMVVVASTRDDESPLPVAEYSVPRWDEWDAGYISYTVIHPSDEAECPMGTAEPGVVRLGDWLGRLSWGDSIGWPCGGEFLESRGPLAAFASCGTPQYLCHSRPILSEADGQPGCRVFAHSYEPSKPCDPLRGWVNPSSGPLLGTDAWGEYRRCEVRRLAGDAAAACHSNYDCPGCSSGFCAAKLPALAEVCAPGEYPTLRFVGGALGGPGAGYLDITCLVESLQ